MNHFKNDDYKSHIDEPWVSGAIEQLSQPLNPSIRAQLKQARATALDKSARKSRLSPVFIWGLPTLASLVAIMVTFSLWQQPDNDSLLETAKNATIEDIAIIEASDDLEFYQNIEFLLWMEQVDNGLTKG